MLKFVERLDDRDLGAAELVILQRVRQEALEGRLQVGGEPGEALFSDDRRRRGDDQVRSVLEPAPQLGLNLGGGLLRSRRIAASFSSSDNRLAILFSRARDAFHLNQKSG